MVILKWIMLKTSVVLSFFFNWIHRLPVLFLVYNPSEYKINLLCYLRVFLDCHFEILK